MQNCKCGNLLKYEDNSILNVDNDTIGLYYCDKCKKIFDASILDCDEEYSELDKNEYTKYSKWFENEYQEMKRHKLIHFYKGLLTPLGYYEEDKEIYEKERFLTHGLNTYVRWLMDNRSENYYKKNNFIYDRFKTINEKLNKLANKGEI